MESARALLDAHTDAPYPTSLTGGEEVAGVSLVMLDADIAGLAAAFLGGGSLRPDQWWTLRASADDVRAVVPQLSGEAWVYFGRLFALARAVLQHDPGESLGTPGPDA